MPEDINWRVIRVRLFEMGHTFDYIDSLGVQDVGDILGYWSGKSKAEERQSKASKNKTRLGRGKRR